MIDYARYSRYGIEKLKTLLDAEIKSYGKQVNLKGLDPKYYDDQLRLLGIMRK